MTSHTITTEDLEKTRWEKQAEVSPRVARLRSRLLDTEPSISVERACLVTGSYRETDNLPFVLRRARALERVLDSTGIRVGEDELLIGSLTSTLRGVPLFPEFDVGFILDELDTFATRSSERFVISDDDRETLRRLLPWWRGRTLADQALEAFRPEAREGLSSYCFILTALRSGIGHVVVDYPKLLNRGLSGIAAEIDERRSALDPTAPGYSGKLSYYRAARIVCDAAVRFANRHADAALSMSESEADPARRAELELVAERCRRVPAEPALGFAEALQSVWFLQLILQLESNGHSISLGRFDQYLYPFYRDDLAAGALTREAAEELLHCFSVKLSEMDKVRDKVSSVAFGGSPMFQHLSVGGQRRDGRSAVNELSHLCLEATAKVGLIQPSISVRWHYGCPEEFVNHAVRVAAYGLGMPAFFNDEVLVPNMLQLGHGIEDARDYSIVGCTETTVPGISEPWLTGGFINLPKVLELTITDGQDVVADRRNSFRTGAADGFDTFDALLAAFELQLAHYLREQVACDSHLDALHGELIPTPFESLFIGDCLERGRTSLEGGARFNSTTINAVGIANVADSLEAIRELVYDRGELSWDDVRAIIRDDWAGREPLRLRIVRDLPKYGNDVESVDAIAARVHEFIHREIASYRTPRGGPYLNALYSISSHILFAEKVAASLDGRRRGDVLADGGVSAGQGRDVSGPTALLNSVASLDPFKAIGSTLLNMKFHPSVFRTADDVTKVSRLVETFFLKKGQHVQFNVVDAETLRDAQAHPERYRNLVVRVAGFSVDFTTIDPRLQEDIIRRTEIGR